MELETFLPQGPRPKKGTQPHDRTMVPIQCWRCVLLMITVCLSLIFITSYFNSLFLNGTTMPLPFQNSPDSLFLNGTSTSLAFQNTPKQTSKQIQRFFKKSPHLSEHFDRNCYRYNNLKARFICGGPYFNFKNERIFDCAWKLWNTTRNPEEADPWEKKVPHANASASEVAKRPAVHIMFFGDSHIRFIFECFVKRIANQDTKYNVGVLNKWKEIQVVRHTMERRVQQILYLDVPLRVTYKWDPFLENLPSYLISWIAGKEPRPTFLIFGTALHYMRNSTKEYTKFGPERASKSYANHLKVLAPLVKEFAKTASAVFKLSDHLQKHKSNRILNNKNIDLYNDIARKTLSGDHLVLWDSAQPLSDLYNEECRKHDRNTPETYMWICNDKRHIGYIMNNQYLDMYLNGICNKLGD